MAANDEDRSSRFKPGQSGNPLGRPRKPKQPTGSAFDVVTEQSFVVAIDGVPQELSVEEALQHRTYEAALAGHRMAQRTVLRWIEKRDSTLNLSAPSSRNLKLKFETDPTDVDEALLTLGIVSERDRGLALREERDLHLEPWAVQKALSRRTGAKLDDKTVSDIKRCTRDPDSMRWPRGTKA